MDKTIIYYTSNQEEEQFEEKIIKRLLEVAGDIPIISISHKPMKLGKNICIGVHKPTNVLLYHQIILGLKEAKTPFVINAESDFLYCPEYFAFTPPFEDKIYRYNNIRVAWKYHGGFFRKVYSEGAQIVGRNYLLHLLGRGLRGIHMFSERGIHRQLNPYHNVPLEFYGSEHACVTFKTGQSLHKYTAVEKERSLPELPYWGKAVDLRKEMFGI